MSDASGRPYVHDKAGTQSGHPDMAVGEYAKQIEDAVEVQLSERLATLRDRITEAFDDLEVIGFRGELTLVAPPERIVELLTFCRDDPEVRCELLADLSGVHWPAGKRVEYAPETTGWPAYELGDEQGRIEIDYILYSLEHNHRFRIRVNLPDVDPRIATASGVYASAHIMEREAYDFFGVTFEGHPMLTRVLNPDDWEGYPHRKDYPLGGVEVQYKGATIPPPDQRSY
ncbi:MAG: NADH-quinone oxidoreductase subunit C [Actinomycetota bacterium]|nr:NADH-quinone oxidoreductase subunit C [Actinomycetota bacterium]